MTLDFTLRKYEELCKSLLERGIQTLSVRKYLDSKSHDGPILIMQHDVDSYPRAALRMARLKENTILPLHTISG